MKGAIRWLLPVALLGGVVLALTGGLETRLAILMLAGVEGVVLLVGVGGVLVVVRRYRGGRRGGLSTWAAFEDGLSVVLPRPVARLVVSEPRMFVCLSRWALRRFRLGEAEFGYARRSAMGTLLVMVGLTAPVEVVFWELLVPWAWVRLALLVLSVYSVLWLFGLYASRITLPHRFEEDGLRLRLGLFAEAFVPYAEVAGAEKKRLRSPRSGDGLHVSPDEDAAYLGINGGVDLGLVLKRPLGVRGFFRETVPVGTLRVAADEPEGMLRELRRRLETAFASFSP